MSDKDKIEVPEWWNVGNGMSYRRDALPIDHPEHTYNYMKNVMNVVPEEYGIYQLGKVKVQEKTESVANDFDFIKIEITYDKTEALRRYEEALKKNEDMRDARISFNQWLAEMELSALGNLMKYY